MKAPKNSCQVNFSSVILTSQKAQVSVEASIINTDCLKVRFRNKTKMKIINIFFLQSLILFVKFEKWKLYSQESQNHKVIQSFRLICPRNTEEIFYNNILIFRQILIFFIFYTDWIILVIDTTYQCTNEFVELDTDCSPRWYTVTQSLPMSSFQSHEVTQCYHQLVLLKC